MTDTLSRLKRYDFLIAYGVVIAATALLLRFRPSLAYPVSVLIMLGLPQLMGGSTAGLKWDTKGVLVGFVVSLVVLGLYVFVLSVFFGVGTGKLLVRSEFTEGLLLYIVAMFLVALSEEFFFRGYLQEKIGMTVIGVVVVSVLFAAGHFVTSFFGAGSPMSLSLKALLTFFPSLVMGYMYLRFRTLWASILFHFLANIVYIGVGG